VERRRASAAPPIRAQSNQKLPVDGLEEGPHTHSDRLQENGVTDPTARGDILQGTLEMLVLKTLTLEPLHGWGLSVRLRQISGEVFEIHQGSLYPALQRMLRRGWIRAEWRATENNRRARYYEITREGRRQLDAQIAEWDRSSGAVNRVLRFAFQGG
jgi:transcriptional regulator